MSLALCSRGGLSGGGQRFLYEARPDLFPQGFLTTDELELWGMYYQDLDQHRTKK